MVNLCTIMNYGHKEVNLEELTNQPKPKVSVYMPAYGCKEYIGEAVESILKQTHSRVEVCICVDGDYKVLEEVNRLFKHENRVKWTYQKNKGIGGASNTAIRKLATGKYIAQLDPDDFVEPTAIEKLVGVLEKNPEKYGGAFTDFDFVDKKGKLLKEGHKRGKAFDRHYLRELGCCVKPMRMWRKDLWDLTEGFDESLPAAVDTDMMLKLDEVFEERGLTFGYVPEVMYHYRWHGNNVSIKKRGKQAKASVYVRKRAKFKRLHKENKLSTDYMPLHLDDVIGQISRRGDISENVKKRFNSHLEELYLNTKGSETILDIGCNTGILTRSLAKLGFFVHGIDISERKIEIAQRDCKRLKDVLCYSVEDGTKFEHSRKYDVINISEVLEHIPNYEEVMERALMHLNENGKIFVSVPNENKVYDPGHINYFDKKIIRELAKKYELQVKFQKHANLSKWLFATLEAKN
jgi:ubiquinone biosynthesis O-methyltransferase